ncbi:hypothetical protein TWF281_007526 [Arthrobotrys megalospora]
MEDGSGTNAEVSSQNVFPLYPVCAVCLSRTGVFLCAKCSAIHYCSTAHQLVDSSRHEPSCALIQKHTAAIPEELRTEFLEFSDSKEFLSLETGFVKVMKKQSKIEEEGGGHEREWLGRYLDEFDQNYSRRIERLAIQLMKVNTLPATELAFDYLRGIQKILYVSERRGPTGPSLPALLGTLALLRLRDDQSYFNAECCRVRAHRRKWIPRINHDTPIVWAANKLFGGSEPRIDVILALCYPVQEYIGHFRTECPSGITLCITWCLRDLETLDAFRKVESWFINRLSYDVVQLITEELFDTTTLRARGFREFHEGRRLKWYIEKLKAARNYCFKSICFNYPRFWTRLLAALDRNLHPRFPKHFEARRSIEFLKPWWRATPGAVEWVRQSLEEFPDGEIFNLASMRRQYWAKRGIPNIAIFMKLEADRVNGMT